MKLEIADPVFNSYAFYSGILVAKMLLMSLLTARQRFAKKIFANPDDVKMSMLKDAKVKFDDPDVERIRRAHLNDLENIPVFFIIALLYCFTHPDPGTANLVFKVFASARIFHSFVYAVYFIRQPARVLSFAVAQMANAYMAIKVIMYFW